jgi:hypothetical protein
MEPDERNESILRTLRQRKAGADNPFLYTQHEYMMMLLEQALENDRLSDNAKIRLAKIISVTGWSGGMNLCFTGLQPHKAQAIAELERFGFLRVASTPSVSLSLPCEPPPNPHWEN